MPQSDDLTDKKFGMIRVLQFAGLLSANGHSYDFWYCQCECGRTFFAQGEYIKKYAVQNCGCVNKELRVVL